MSWTVTKQVQALLGHSLERLESPSLRLEKMLYMRRDMRRGQNHKENQIDAVVKCHESHAKVPKIGFADISDAHRLVMKLEGKLLVNHAGGILENTGICLHRHFGCPYIPGSAVKGVARHAAWQNWSELPEGKQKQTAALQMALTFGYPCGGDIGRFLSKAYPQWFDSKGILETCAGTVCFLPAFPVTAGGDRKPKLVKDITTCHHRDYYGGRQKEAFDNEEPIVLPFPAVEAGATFEFTLKPTQRGGSVLSLVGDALPADFSVVDYAEKCLRLALEENGIGAKTAAGYGWFEEDIQIASDIEKQRKSEIEAESQRREKAETAQRERERLASMSPFDRRVEEIAAMPDDDFKPYLANLESQEQEERKAVLNALLKNKLHIWLKDKNGKKKAARRAEIMRKLAAEFGVELP